MGLISEKQNKLKEAINFYKKVLKLNPKYVYAKNCREKLNKLK
jgi:hypothetical protein